MKGLDISFSEPSSRWWEDRRAEGFEVMVQNLWTGGFASNEGIKAVAANNLRRARVAGYRIAAYANASPADWWSLQIQLDNIKINAGSEWANLGDVVVDAEIPRLTMARVMELADGLEAAGKVADVLYTAHWFWAGHMGNSTDAGWKRFRLWPADYDGDPTLDFPRPFGPWTLADLIGKQHAGTTYIEKQAIDLNTFRDSWLAPTSAPEPGPTPPPVEEEPIVGKIKDIMTRAGAEIEAEVEAAKKLPIPIKGDTGKTGATGATGPAGGGATGAVYDTLRASDRHATGFAERHGMTLAQLQALNPPPAPPSGDWNLVREGDRFRIA